MKKAILFTPMFLLSLALIAQKKDRFANNKKTAHLTETNRSIVEAFAEMFYSQKNVEKAFSEFVSENYIQHNPNILDSRKAAVEMLKPKFSNQEAIFDVKRIIVDGNLAVIHLYARMNSNALGGAVADIYRLENGKIVEHWDVLQAIPEKPLNPHAMF